MTGVLASMHGSLVAFGAVMTVPDLEGRPRRFLSVLASFSQADSGLLLQTSLDWVASTSSSPFLRRPSAPGGTSVAARAKPTSLSCTLKTAACLGLIAIGVATCPACVAPGNPVCIACIIAAGIFRPVCCSACHCWRARGVSISCGC